VVHGAADAEPTYGFKVLIEEESDRVLGAYLVGPHADEVINLFALAIRHGLTAEALKSTVFAYPTGASDIGYMLYDCRRVTEGCAVVETVWGAAPGPQSRPANYPQANSRPHQQCPGRSARQRSRAVVAPADVVVWGFPRRWPSAPSGLPQMTSDA
jgi:hypothetical protein